MTDDELLRRHGAGDGGAFAELVRRHADVVYGAAVRQAGAGQAEDVVQGVFLLLARKWRKASGGRLVGWLLKATFYACRDVRKRERRRRRNEERAMAMRRESIGDEEGERLWEEIRPELDGALMGLGEVDRTAVALRVLEGRSWEEVGAVAGMSEEAARKRVGRALEKLRKQLRKRGVAAPAAVLAVVIGARAAQAAPATVMEGIGQGGTAGGTGGAGAIARATERAMTMAKAKLAAAVGTGVVVAALALVAAARAGGGGPGTADGGTDMKLDDVVRQVGQSKVVTCQVETTITVAQQGQEKVDGWMAMSEEGWSEMMLPGTHAVVNARAGKMLLLDDGKKEAEVVDLQAESGGAGAAAAGGRGAPNLLTVLEHGDLSKGERVGERTVAGQKCLGFHVPEGGKIYTVWADETTRKPVEVTVHVSGPMIPDVDFTCSGFDWNPPAGTIGETDGALQVPAGYTAGKLAMKMGASSEADVASMLRTVADLNGGVLPEAVDMESLYGVLEDWSQGQPGGGADRATMMKKMMPVGRAWAYMTSAANGGQWTYAGDGVKVGTAGKAVLWYQPAGQTGWRVFDADGRVHEEKEAPAGGKRVKVEGASLGVGTQPAGKGEEMP